MVHFKYLFLERLLVVIDPFVFVAGAFNVTHWTWEKSHDPSISLSM